MNDDWTDRHGRQKTLRVLAFCLYYHSMTIQHLVDTYITPLSSYSTEKSFMNRLARKGYFKTTRADSPGFSAALYTITAAGVKLCINKLEKMLESDKRAGIDYGIDNKCLEYLANRVKGHGSVSNIGHFTGIRSVNAAAIDILNNPRFTYDIEVGTDSSGREYSYEARLDTDIAHKGSSLFSDAVLKLPVDYYKNPLRYYIEQDMNSQRAAVIKNKVKQYIEYVYLNHQNNPFAYNVVFSIFTRQAVTKNQSTSSAPYSIAADTYNKLISLAAYSISQRNQKNDIYDVSLNEIYDFIVECLEKTNEYSEFYFHVADYIQNILQEYPDINYQSFIEYVRKKGKKNADEIAQTRLDAHRTLYNSRRASIQKNVLKASPLVDKAFLNGFSIYTTHVSQHKHILPFIMPLPETAAGDILRKTLVLYGDIPDYNTAFKYSLVSDTKDSMGFVLKNSYSFENGTTVYVENISDDIGGYKRVEKYLDTIHWAQGEGILLCLVADDDVDTAKQLFLKSKYAELMFSGKPIALSLKIFFVQYSSFSRGKDVFSFNEKGISELRPIHF